MTNASFSSYKTQEETATFAGGCFWCLEAVFQRLNGIEKVVSGYTGGQKPNPTYQEVSSGETGHAETIQITFDPQIISYKTLLEVFWHMHDPTTLNRQGNDVGTQYRSVIFYHTPEQKLIAEESKKQTQAKNIYSGKLVTEIVPATPFYPAENHHQNYYNKNSYQPYCQYVIDPKIRKLFKKFSSVVKPNTPKT